MTLRTVASVWRVLVTSKSNCTRSWSLIRAVQSSYSQMTSRIALVHGPIGSHFLRILIWLMIVVVKLLFKVGIVIVLMLLNTFNLSHKIQSLLWKRFDWWRLAFKSWAGGGIAYPSQKLLLLSYELLIILRSGLIVMRCLLVMLPRCYFQYFVILAKRKELYFFMSKVIQV